MLCSVLLTVQQHWLEVILMNTDECYNRLKISLLFEIFAVWVVFPCQSHITQILSVCLYEYLMIAFRKSSVTNGI